jgi:hypothetical protein
MNPPRALVIYDETINPLVRIHNQILEKNGTGADMYSRRKCVPDFLSLEVRKEGADSVVRRFLLTISKAYLCCNRGRLCAESLPTHQCHLARTVIHNRESGRFSNLRVEA